MTVTQYAVEDADGAPIVSYIYTEQEYEEARRQAREYGGKVVAYEYEFSDSHVVADFTADGDVQ